MKINNALKFIISSGKELDHIIILVQFKSKNEEKNTGIINSKTPYKILLIRNTNLELDWK